MQEVPWRMDSTGCIVRTLLLALCAALGVGGAAPVSARFGLDERPANPSCQAMARPDEDYALSVEQAFTSLDFKRPLAMAQSPGDASHWYLAERAGIIWRFPNLPNADQKSVFLDIESLFQFTSVRTFAPGEDSQQWGITSFAFHPDFEANGEVYVAYNAKPSLAEPIQSRVSRFTLSPGATTVAAASEEELLSVEQTPQSVSHHLGQIAFGGDGYLYVGYGDGGRQNEAQDLSSLKGKILRLDVDSDTPYAIPADNPFAGSTSDAPEVIAYGLRNPWRFSFDRSTDSLWAGDVGSGTADEVLRVELGGNYGWPIMEGVQCTSPGCDTGGLVPPILNIGRDGCTSVTGGFVYRGDAIASLFGTYVFGDACRKEVFGLVYNDAGDAVRQTLAAMPIRANAFAEGHDGELYVTEAHITTPSIWKIVPRDSDAPPVVGAVPQRLSESGCVNPDSPMEVASGLIPYTVNSPFWSDGADKQRWLAIPDGETVTVNGDGEFEFPIGTVLMKRFSFDGVPFETRLFMRHDDGGWAGYSYEWKDDLSEALLLSAQKNKTLTGGQTWTYPGRAQCLDCHTRAAGFSLGLETAQLNGTYRYQATGREANQLTTLAGIGLFSTPLSAAPSRLHALADPTESSVALKRRARSYLHANCAGCHRPDGPTQARMDLRFQTDVADMRVCNVDPTQGDLGIASVKLVAPGDSAASMIAIRPQRLDVHRMPPVASRLLDDVGVELLKDWTSLSGVCESVGDGDGDGVYNDVDNCLTIANVDQSDVDADGFGNMCDGDFTGDGQTNTLDLAVFARAHRTCRGDPRFDERVDLTGDGCIDTLDLNAYRRLHRKPPGPSAVFP